MAKTKVRTSFRDRLETSFMTIKSPTIHLGFSDINIWASTGNYAMNRRWSGRFDRAVLFGREYILYGESGSGKSLIWAWVAADAQRQHNAFVVWMDVEKATNNDIGKAWLKRAGIDMDNCQYLRAATFEDIKKLVSDICRDCRKTQEEGGEIQPIVIVIDSWAAAMTKSQLEHAIEGDVVGDQGQKAKQTGDTINAINHIVDGLPIMVLGVQHVMMNQDKYGERFTITGGLKAVYYASGCMLLTKKELSDEDLENKDVQQHYLDLKKGMSAEVLKKYGKKSIGITCVMKTLKTRVTKPFEKVEIQIPYLTGMDPYSGLFDLLMQEGVITVASQGWYAYTNQGNEVKFQKAKFLEHADLLMKIADEDVSKIETVSKEPTEETSNETN